MGERQVSTNLNAGSNTDYDKIVILNTSAPYSTPLLFDRLNIIDAMAEHCTEVIVFFYIDGIHQLNSDQIPSNFPNIGKHLEAMLKRHDNVQFLACSRCVGSRGYLDLEFSDFQNDTYLSQKFISGVKIVSIRSLAEFLKKGYKIMQI